MALNNDQVMPEMGLDFGAQEQIASGIINPNIQAVGQVEQYRRVLRSTSTFVPSSGAGSAATIDFINKAEETRRFFLGFIASSIAADLRVIATIQRGTSGQLLMQVMDCVVPSLKRVFILGKFERFSLGLGGGSAAQYPVEIIQPIDSTLIFKISNDGGGLLPAGSFTMQTSYWREPPLRSWLVGKADAIVAP